MDLYVVRHAIAEDATPGQADADRALTRDGRERFEGAVRGMRALGIRLERVLHSPWKRAAQTAELLAPIVRGPVQPTPLLAKAPTRALLDAIRHPTEEGPVAIVGHQPWLSQVVTWLAFGAVDLGERVDLKKGGVVWLQGDAKSGAMRLRGYFTPRVLRAVRR